MVICLESYIIDAALLSAEDTLSSIEDTLTSLEGKIDALASASGGIIKSIQSLEISHDAREALDQRYPITTVDPARSIVFLTHQKQQTNGAVINWTLYADNLHVTATEGAYAFFNVKFQIVEFY